MARVKIGNVRTPIDYLKQFFAPAGYGLGENLPKIVSTPDEATLNGFYSIANNDYVGDGTFVDWRLGYAQIFVQRLGLRIAQNAKYNDVEWKRNSSDNGATWQPWEWVTPPMVPGVEYRTPERWNSKVVYTALVDCGACTSPSKETTTNFTCEQIIRHCGTVGGHSLPAINATLDNAWSAWAMVTNSDGRVRVTVYNGTGMVGETAMVQVWYTKE